MKLIISVPDTYSIEREYIIFVVCHEFLGLDYIIQKAGQPNIYITDSDNNRRLLMPDKLFSTPLNKWLTNESLPRQPLKVWDPGSMPLAFSNDFKPVPVIYGSIRANDTAKTYPSHDASTLRMPIDIFGSAFFMLTRYEEIVKSDRDEHDRFPAHASLAFQENFLIRSIIDEYIEILWAAIKFLWPGLRRKEKIFSRQVSHDVDTPSRYGFLSPWQVIRAMGGDIIKRGDISGAMRGPWLRLNANNQLHPKDPYNTFDWIMDVSEKHGLISAFYFICGQTHKSFDGKYDIANPALRHLLRHIHERGHEIGLHPSYNTFRNPRAIACEAERLKRICAEEGIAQTSWGGRMHYLRWDTPTTLYGWEQAGMTYDSTMSYADHTGFRCGTCHEYPAFDPVNRKALKLRIRPLIAMECTITDKKYMGLGQSYAAYEEFIILKNACRRLRGNFSVLWHNTRLTNPKDRELYETVIKG